MKAIKIVDELLSYFFSYHIMNVQIDIQYGMSEVAITVEGDTETRPDNLEELDEVLNKERQVELEEYYWSLLGENRNYHELNLLGSFVDRANIVFENSHLSVTVYRKRQ